MSGVCGDLWPLHVMVRESRLCFLPISCLLLFVVPGHARIISLPDLHGDYERATTILAAAGLIDPRTLAWTGGNAILVQTGDIVDRGDHGKRIYELFFRLAAEAASSGGRVVNLLGNHEAMNLGGDFSYVSRGDVEEFGGREARAKAWAAGGWLRAKVASFPAAVIAGNVLFVHAGLLPRFFRGREGLSGINGDILAALSSAGTAAGSSAGASLLGGNGPLWTRHFADGAEASVCKDARDVLWRAGALRMVVGHTVQQTPQGFRVRAICGGQVLLADTAVSRAYGGEMSFIEHDGEGGAVAVYPARDQRDTLPRPPGRALATALEGASKAGSGPPWSVRELIFSGGRSIEEGFEDGTVLIPWMALSLVLVLVRWICGRHRTRSK